MVSIRATRFSRMVNSLGGTSHSTVGDDFSRLCGSTCSRFCFADVQKVLASVAGRRILRCTPAHSRAGHAPGKDLHPPVILPLVSLFAENRQHSSVMPNWTEPQACMRNSSS